MARPAKETVDYFPHFCEHGKTLFIIEQHYGNDGYAFWFKLLELLGKTEGHFYDCSGSNSWEFLQAKTRFLGVKCQEILDKLALLGAIDQFLWENDKIIWSDNLVENVADAYRNRRKPIPKKPVSRCRNPENHQITNVSTVENPQTKLNEIILKETTSSPTVDTATVEIVDNSGEDGLSQAIMGDEGSDAPDQPPGSDFMAFWGIYPRREGITKAEAAFDKAVNCGLTPQALVIAAGKYATKAATDKTPHHEILMPDEFLQKGAYRRYLPASSTKPPDCSKCADREYCREGVIIQEVPYELGGTRMVTTPCPHKRKAGSG